MPILSIWQAAMKLNVRAPRIHYAISRKYVSTCYCLDSETGRMALCVDLEEVRAYFAKRDPINAETKARLARIRARLAAGESQTQVARGEGVSRQYVSLLVKQDKARGK